MSGYNEEAKYFCWVFIKDFFYSEELDVDLSHDKLPDPELDMIKTLSHRISDLQLQLEKLKKELEDSKNNHA